MFERLARLVRTTRRVTPGMIRRLLVFEAGGIGDLMWIFPAITALKTHFSQATLTLVLAKGSLGIWELFPDRTLVDKLVVYDVNGVHRGILKKLRLIDRLRSNRYDLVYMPTRGEGARENNIIAFLLGISHRIGFANKGTCSFHTVQQDFKIGRPILEQNLELLEHCGITVPEREIRIRVPKDDRFWAQQKMQRLVRPSIIVHMNASWHGHLKIWPTNNWVKLIKMIIKEIGGTVILIGSPNEEMHGNTMLQSIKHPSLKNWIGKTSLAQAAALIEGADFFIGIDSGPMHIALALKVPSVILFGPTAPHQIITPKERQRCEIIRKELDCAPCYLHQYNFLPVCNTIQCMTAISVEDVIQGLRTILKRNHKSL